MNSNLKELSWRIYHNPSSGTFTIDLLNQNIAGEISISIMNTVNQTVFYWEGNFSFPGKRELHLTGVGNGIYFLEVRSGSFRLREKLIISR